eukprot:Pgem_evm1s16133
MMLNETEKENDKENPCLLKNSDSMQMEGQEQPSEFKNTAGNDPVSLSKGIDSFQKVQGMESIKHKDFKSVCGDSVSKGIESFQRVQEFERKKYEEFIENQRQQKEIGNHTNPIQESRHVISQTPINSTLSQPIETGAQRLPPSPQAQPSQQAPLPEGNEPSGLTENGPVFSVLEIKNLVQGVKTYGHGNWAHIMQVYNFEKSKTEQDLMVKWEAMKKRYLAELRIQRQQKRQRGSIEGVRSLSGSPTPIEVATHMQLHQKNTPLSSRKSSEASTILLKNKSHGSVPPKVAPPQAPPPSTESENLQMQQPKHSRNKYPSWPFSRNLFEKKLSKVHKENKSVPQKNPNIAETPIDLLQLYKLVVGYGGWNKVFESSKWPKIAQTLQFEKKNNIIYRLKRIYLRNLFFFEK